MRSLIPNPKPIRLRRRLAVAVLNAVLMTAPVAIAMHMPISMTYATPEHGAAAALPTPAEVAFEEHRCWTGEDEPLVEGFPGHVLLSDGSIGGPRLVSRALEQIFDGKDHGLTIYAFCV